MQLVTLSLLSDKQPCLPLTNRFTFGIPKSMFLPLYSRLTFLLDPFGILNPRSNTDDMNQGDVSTITYSPFPASNLLSKIQTPILTSVALATSTMLPNQRPGLRQSNPLLQRRTL